MLQKVLKLSAAKIAAYLFGPVLVAVMFVLLERQLTGFLIFQLFIEGFVIWQLAIGLVLYRFIPHKRQIFLFVFNMTIGILYRLTTNVQQIFVYLDTGKFSFFETPLWVIPVHLYATVGVVYCFYLNARWIQNAEQELAISSSETTVKTFFGLLIFPVGLWSIQPRLNKIAEKMALGGKSHGLNSLKNS